MAAHPLNVLLIDDDEDAYVATRYLLSSLPGWKVQLDWVQTYDEGLAGVRRQAHDVYLIDYRLDARDGLELLQEAIGEGCDAPMIMLTGLKDREVDLKAMQAGAADYLVKDRLDSTLLERSLRYSLDRQRLRREVEEKAARLRTLAGQLSQAEQHERSRVARLLHDHFQQILVSIKMHVESLTPDQLAQQQRHVQGMLDQALEVSRTLTMELSPPILMDAGLAAALAWLSNWMNEKYGLHVEADIDAEAEPASDPVRLMLFHSVREVLFNVTKHAGVSEARLTMSQAGDQVSITVADEGEGFDPQCLTPERAPQSGFGLVHLCERIQLVGGTLKVDTAPGQGCHITLLAPRVPLSEPVPASSSQHNGKHHAHAAPPDKAAPPPGDHRIRVLLVDDHPVLREGLARTLSDQKDVEVVGEASDGQEGVEMTEQLHPEIVIMDVVMPRLNGFDATSRITAEWPDVRVIALSMYSDDDMARVMRKAGASAYVSKGGPVETLLHHIRELAASARRARQASC